MARYKKKDRGGSRTKITPSPAPASQPPAEAAIEVTQEVLGNEVPAPSESAEAPKKKKHKAAPPLEEEAAPAADQTPPPWKPQQRQAARSERVIPAPTVPALKKRRNAGRKKTYFALVELFTGLRTTYLAARHLEDA